jgi:Flp pilus assembly protein TadG
MAALNLHLRKRGGRDERGAELIEMALVTPIFLIIIAAMFDFGFLFRNWEVATNAAREGARVGVLPSYTCLTGTLDVKDRVDTYMAAAGFNAASYQVKQTNEAVVTAAGTFNACVVSVEITQPMPMLGAFSQFFGGGFGTVPLRATSVMRSEAQANP